MIILSLILVLFSTIFPYFYNQSQIKVFATNICYARVLTDNVYLYKSALSIEDASNVYFEIPKTYFVALLSNANQDFYQAKYLDFSGFVKKESVQAISGTPNNPYLEGLHFRVYSEQSRELRSQPNHINGENDQIAYIPLYNKNLTFYGKIKGEAVVLERTNIWYYCKYTADKEYIGYVYSDFCDGLPNELPKNTEEVTYSTNPTFEKIVETTTKPTNNALGIVIAILCLPSLAFVFLITKGKNIVPINKTKTKEVVDY